MTKLKKIILISSIIFIIILVIFILFGKRYYDDIYTSNTKNVDKEEYIYIPTNSNFDSVVSILANSNFIKDTSSFIKVAQLKKYHNKIYPGRYKITASTSNNELVNNLRSGNQSPILVSFISQRSLNLLAKKIDPYIEADSLSLINAFNNDSLLSEYSFDKESVMAMFIPNSYEFFWNTSAEDFMKRMKKEYDNFWNSERTKKAEEIGFSKIEISIIASIVEEETNKNDEKSRIAGVYINRLNKGMLLQADPTVKFAVGDNTLTQILNRHLKIDSPYNTYLYEGLPPGPICIPSIASIDAVLNYEKHNYYYFCAKADFSGYHNFAITLAQHNVNANNYHNALRIEKYNKQK